MREKERERQASGMLLKPLPSLYIYMYWPRDVSKEGRKDRHHRDETETAMVVDHSETTESKFRICFRISRGHRRTCDARTVESECNTTSAQATALSLLIIVDVARVIRFALSLTNTTRGLRHDQYAKSRIGLAMSYTVYGRIRSSAFNRTRPSVNRHTQCFCNSDTFANKKGIRARFKERRDVFRCGE